MVGLEFIEYDLCLIDLLIDCDWFCWFVVLEVYDMLFCIGEVFDVMYVKLKGWFLEDLCVYSKIFFVVVFFWDGY